MRPDAQRALFTALTHGVYTMLALTGGLVVGKIVLVLI